jgi:hypothetical protein
LTPRLRPELNATPIEEQGLKFFDVSDPRSGAKMRLYDFEWLLASQMDGQRSLDEIARWAHGALSLDVTGPNLATYAQRLAELGFFSLPEAPAVLPKRDPNALTGTTTPLPPPAPSGQLIEEDVPLELNPEEVDDATTKQIALPPAAPPPSAPPPAAPPRPIVEATKPRTDEKTDRNTAARPVERALAFPPPSEEDVPARSGSRSIVWLLLVLLIVGGVVAYVMFFNGVGGGTKVSTQIARTREIAALYEGAAKLGKSNVRVLSFGESGKVTDMVAAGTEVKAGMPLATLEGFSKVEKELADVKDRLGFYQKQLEAASGKSESAQKAAAEKVNEKKKILAELEARAGKLRLVAPGPGVVDKVHVSAGGDAKADAPAIELTGNGVAATFKLGADAAALKVGDEATLQGPSGATGAGKIAKIDNGEVTIEVADTAAFKAGDEVRLVKSKLSGVVAVPTAAVVKKNGTDTVFVLSQGTLHAKKVTLADRAGGEIYVSNGLAAGDQVVTSGGDALNDGDKASASQ